MTRFDSLLQPFAEARNIDMPELIETGERLPRIQACSPAMYALLLRCWEYDSDARPTFKGRHMASLFHDDVTSCTDVVTELDIIIGSEDVSPEDASALLYLSQHFAVVKSSLEHELQEVKLKLMAAKRNTSAPSV